MVRSGGHVMAGGCWSSTVTVKVQVLRLPLASVAVLATVVTPSGKVLPLGGLLTRLVNPAIIGRADCEGHVAAVASARVRRQHEVA